MLLDPPGSPRLRSVEPEPHESTRARVEGLLRGPGRSDLQEASAWPVFFGSSRMGDGGNEESYLMWMIKKLFMKVEGCRLLTLLERSVGRRSRRRVWRFSNALNALEKVLLPEFGWRKMRHVRRCLAWELSLKARSGNDAFKKGDLGQARA